MRPRQHSTHRTMKPADGRHGQRVRGQGRGKMLVATSVQRHMNNNYLLIYNHVIIILFGPFNYHKRRESRQKNGKNDEEQQDAKRRAKRLWPVERRSTQLNSTQQRTTDAGV